MAASSSSISSAPITLTAPSPVWVEAQESSKVKASIERVLSPSAAKTSIWDYSIQDISALEGDLKQLKQKEGKGSESYLALKEAVDALRMAHLPFRTYVRWKNENTTEIYWCFFPEYREGVPSNKTKGPERKAFKQKLLGHASVPEMQERFKLLSKLTFLHGTNSASLIMMLLSDRMFRWVGDLFNLSMGPVAPMYGELGIGVCHRGVNLGAASTCTVSNIRMIMGYTSKNPTFSVEKLPLFDRPLNQLDLENHFREFVRALASWRKSDPEGYFSQLSPGMQRTEELIKELNCAADKISAKGPDAYPDNYLYYVKLRGNLITLAECLRAGLDFPDTTGDAQENFWANFRDILCAPYRLLCNNQRWTEHAIQVLQLKQWDPQTFHAQITPHREEWLHALQMEKDKHAIPMQRIIALLNHSFTEKESAFIQKQRHGNFTIFDEMQQWAFGDPEVPPRLRAIFPTLDDIPKFSSGARFNVINLNQLQGEIPQYRNHYIYDYYRNNYKWSDLFEKILSVKIQESSPMYLHEVLSVIEAELNMLESDFRPLYTALVENEPAVLIPPDDKIRSLITNPIPLVYASTTVTPRPLYGPFGNVQEHLLNNPVKLGRGGIDILFTDTEESKQRIYELLPEDLKEEIEIHLFNELEVDMPLIHAPYQIDRTTG